jgi:carboxypeptidase family protein
MIRIRAHSVLIQTLAFLLLLASAFGQETTAGLQGTVKDSTGAVVANAHVAVTGASLTGIKSADTDGSGYYRFANIPPGSYTVTVTAQGFTILKREGLILEVGHLPTVDFALQVGASETVVEVSGAAPAVDVTTNVTQTNITQDVVQDVPHGRSFQSVIQFAPSARNEPLQGNNMISNGTGGSSPGSSSNGGDHGFSVAGGSDSENSYLVEGQETANLIGGYSHTNVPFDFIQEVQIKSSGIEAEHGGALGGVVNVVMKKGSNGYHGSLFTQFENGGMDGSPTPISRYDPSSGGTSTAWGNIDPTFQLYQPVRPKTSDVFPGFTFGGPILKDRIFGFVGFNPEWNDVENTLNYGPTNGGLQHFSQNTQTYYTTARVDAVINQKIRVFGSWLYQLQRQNGEAFYNADSTTGFFNSFTGCFGAATSAGNPCISSGVPPFALSHGLGYVAPNTTTNVGADFTITPRLVATSRFGYYFENYHDFGYPTTGTIDFFASSGINQTDTTGALLPSQLQQGGGSFNIAQNSNYTQRNADKAIQFDQSLAWYKSGWKGTHNFKFGYDLNRLSNDLDQHFNTPYIQFLPGTQITYSPQGPVGAGNCATVEGLTGFAGCVGTYGNLDVYDYGSLGKATSYNHSLFAQDAWTLGRGITINAGVRLEHEYLPAENQPNGTSASQLTPINFGWGSKVAPRIGAAWDVFRDGRMKVFGSYGQFYDQMKLNLAISSFGGQYWQECYYAMMSSNISSFNPVFNGAGRYCPGPTSGVGANWAGGVTPAGLTFLESQNVRAFPTTCPTCSSTEEGVAPGLNPYEQHESVFGFDYQLRKNLSFEARWDRRRLDHVIEDSAIFNPAVGETFVIVNPGQGVNKTFPGFYDFLYPNSPLVCNATNPCPTSNTIPAARSYDGLEFRINKAHSDHWFGMFSYTYSKLRGNYTGLTSSDVADGGGGRNAPNNSRSFDEPMFSWNADGGSSSGLLPTDRPNAFKGYAYYELGWMKKWTSDIGLFQYAYSGTPLTSYEDVGYGFQPPTGAFPTDVVDRGKWVSATQDPTTGTISFGPAVTNRTPWYTQTDFNFTQNYKVSEGKVLSFSATFANLFNQRAVVSDNQQIDSNNFTSFIGPGGLALPNGTQFYAAAESPYNYQALTNAAISSGPTKNFPTGNGPLTLNSGYGQPYLFQIARTIRLGAKFTF